MKDSPTFEWTCTALQGASGLTRLSARGTVRIALRRGGLEPHQVGAAEMTLVLERLLPDELKLRGIEKGEAICQQLIHQLKGSDLPATGTRRFDAEQTLGRIFGQRASEE